MQFKKVISLLVTTVIGSCGLLACSASAATENKKADKCIALTFDDGPNTTTTTQVLDILEQYNAKASFFLIGNNINDESAAFVKRAYDMGCDIGNHSKTHSNMGSMSVEDINAEISYVEDWVTEITGEGTKYFRAPFIDVSDTMYDAIDQIFICGIDPQDYMANITAQERADFILNNAKDGVIVLLHDAAGNDQTVEALKIAIPQLIEQGYDLVTLTELFERQNETPNVNLMYSEVAKYPCTDYKLHENIMTGNVSGAGSDACWSDAAVLDGAILQSLGEDYAIEVQYESRDYPVVTLQSWSGASIWHTVKPFYYNGSKACFLASDILSALETLGVSYDDLDRMTIRPFNTAMTMTQVDLLVKSPDATTEQPDTQDYHAGDVNCDGDVKINDVILLNRMIAEDTTATISEQGIINADCDGKDGVNSDDAIAILKMLAGL